MLITSYSLGWREAESSHIREPFIPQPNKATCTDPVPRPLTLSQDPVAPRKAVRGFTLIELMIVIALLAIFVGIAVPSFTTLIANTRTETTASELHGLLMSARANAVTQRIQTTVATGTSSWEIKQGTTVSGTLAIPADVTLSSPDLASLTFNSDGSASAPATLCLENNRGNRAYKISIERSGIIRLSSAADCS